MDSQSVPASIRVLVVDDSSVIRRLVSIVLERFGLEAAFTDNGIDALKMLKSTSYDIVFLDVVMPGLDGYQVCKRIKADKSTRDIPVIMLTSKDGTFDKIRGKMAGSNHYLTKPVNMSEFANTLKQFLPLYNFNGGAKRVKTKVVSSARTPRKLNSEAAVHQVRPSQASSLKTDLSSEKIIKIRK